MVRTRSWLKASGIAGILLLGAYLRPFVIPEIADARTQARRTVVESGRIGVVDTAAVMRDYSKTRSIEAALVKKGKALRESLQRLENRSKEIEFELKVLTRGAQDEKLLENFQLGLRMRRIREDDLPALGAEGLVYQQQIHAEVGTMVRTVARAGDFDFVLEKAFIIDTPTGRRSWPIVHYSKSKFNLTSEITLRLNDAYKKR